MQFVGTVDFVEIYCSDGPVLAYLVFLVEGVVIEYEGAFDLILGDFDICAWFELFLFD